MIHTLAISNYRSLCNLVIPLGQLNLVTGANGSGKSNLYRALKLLADTAQGGVIGALAREGGLQSSLWAGPEKISERMKRGEVKVEGTIRTEKQRVRFGFASEDFGYSISLGLPIPSETAFNLDPEIKQENIWAGDFYKTSNSLVERKGPSIKVRSSRSWDTKSTNLKNYESMISELSDQENAPEIFCVRDKIKSWRFYDHFRTDHASFIREPQIGTRTLILSHDGHDLAAAIQTILEIGDRTAFEQAIEDAFPGAKVRIYVSEEIRFSIDFRQHGLLRPLNASELSDGTLRYLLLTAALLTPRPPSLMVLNEPETSLHPQLLSPLAKLIIRASEQCQIWVVSHSEILIKELKKQKNCNCIEITKEFGETKIMGLNMLDMPPWYWPDKK